MEVEHHKLSCEGRPEAYSRQRAFKFDDHGIMWLHIVNYTKDFDSKDQLLSVWTITQHWNKKLKDHGKMICLTNNFEIAKQKGVLGYWVKEDGWAYKDGKRIWKNPEKFSPNTIAYAYWWMRIMAFNDQMYFTAKGQKGGSMSWVSTGTHEMGHMLGIEHPSVHRDQQYRKDIMWPQHQTEINFTEYTKAGINHIYGSRKAEALVKPKGFWGWVKGIFKLISKNI